MRISDWSSDVCSSDLARQLDATARTRQNLAYTLALAGRWRESKMVASQDLSPQDAGKRVGEWAVLARPGAEAQQVAQLMGVTPQADRKSTRLNSSHYSATRLPSSAWKNKTLVENSRSKTQDTSTITNTRYGAQ